MYNRPAIQLRPIVIIGLLLIVVALAIYAFLHGALATEKNTTLHYASMSSKLSSSVQESKQTRTNVASGSYGVLASGSDISTMSVVNAPHFLLSNKVSQSSNRHKLVVIGRQTDPDLAVEKGDVVSYTDKTIHPLSQTNIDGSQEDDHIDNDIPEFASSFQTGPSTIGGLIDQDESVLPVSYDISSNSIRYYPSLSTTLDDISTQPIDGGFMIFDKKTSKFSIYLADKSDPIQIKIDSASHISKYNGTPVYTYADSKLAVVVGPDYNQVNEEDSPSASDESGDSSIVIIDTNSKKTTRTIDFSSTILTDILLSKSAKNLFVQSTQTSGIYDTSSGKQGLLIPSDVDNILWKDDDTFALTTSTDGVFVGSADEKQATNILPYNKLKPTNLAFFKANSLYFTGYGTAAEGNDKPDAFRYDLTESPTKTSSQIVDKLPHQGNNYYIDSIGDTITIQTTRYITDSETIVDTDAEKAAKKWLSDNFDNLKDYTIKTTYIDNDLRQNDDED